jgi:segregation and condensation protein A
MPLPPTNPRAEASIFDLLNAVNEVLKRVGQRPDLREIFEDKWSVSEKIEFLRNLIAEKPSLKFSDLFHQATSRSEVVCTFLALLELIRLKQLVCVQTEDFGSIEITKAPPPPVVPDVSDVATAS